MNPSLELATRHFPARIAELGFSAALPADWISHPLPDDEVDFDDPTAFVPLAIVTAPHAAIVYAFAARPAHADGTLHDWAWYHLQQQPQLQPRAIGPALVAGVAAVVGEAVQASDLGPMVVRFAFLEDGDRLVQFSLSAPELLADVMRDAWFALLRSFALETARGSRFAVEAGAELDVSPPIPDPGQDSAALAAADGADGVRGGHMPAVLDAETGEPLLVSTALPDPLGPEALQARRAIGDFALDGDSIALDEDHATNVRLRRQGLGEVPAIASLSDSQRRATLAASAIAAEFDLPYGWHAIDDGRRTLVFDPQQRVQIALRLTAREAGGADGSMPPIDAGDDAPRDEWQLLHPWLDDSRWLQVRVSARPQQAAAARQLVELMLASLVYADSTPAREVLDEPSIDEPASDPVSPDPLPGAAPDWWRQAQALEAAGELAAAEALIRDQVPHLGFAASIAQLYRLRMHRLQAAGDGAGAAEAYRQSRNFIGFYASMATSGGEGAALSLERDDFIAQLDAEYFARHR